MRSVLLLFLFLSFQRLLFSQELQIPPPEVFRDKLDTFLDVIAQGGDLVGESRRNGFGKPLEEWGDLDFVQLMQTARQYAAQARGKAEPNFTDANVKGAVQLEAALRNAQALYLAHQKLKPEFEKLMKQVDQFEMKIESASLTPKWLDEANSLQQSMKSETRFQGTALQQPFEGQSKRLEVLTSRIQVRLKDYDAIQKREQAEAEKRKEGAEHERRNQLVRWTILIAFFGVAGAIWWNRQQTVQETEFK